MPTKNELYFLGTSYSKRVGQVAIDSNEDGLPVIKINVVGIAAYLDTFAIIDLATGKAERRDKFLEALASGGFLLFSGANIAELANSKGRVGLFLDAIGANWAPIELAPTVVADREEAGEDPRTACLMKDFVRTFFAARIVELEAGGGVIDLSVETIWRLRSAVDWTPEQFASLQARSAALDQTLQDVIAEARRAYDHNPAQLVAPPSYDPNRRANYVFSCVARQLILEAKSHTFKDGDGMDFCHAVMGAAFGSFALVDKQWKRRLLAAVPDHTNIARLFYAPELDELVDLFYEQATSSSG